MATKNTTWTMTLEEVIKVCEDYQIRPNDCYDDYTAQYIDAVLTHVIRSKKRPEKGHKTSKSC